MRRLRKLICFSLALLWFGGAGIARAEEEMTTEDQKMKAGELTGTVSSVGKNFINVEYSKNKGNSKEMFLPLSNNVQLENFQNLNQLKFGDKVHVQYQQTYKEEKDGEKIILKTVVTGISLLPKPRDMGLHSAEQGATR